MTTKGQVRKTARRAYEGRSDDRRRRKSSKRSVHFLPDAMAAVAVALPFLNNPDGASVVGGLLTPGYDNKTYIVSNFLDGLKGNAKTMAELAVGAYAVKFVGKKLGLNRIGTKEVRLA